MTRRRRCPTPSKLAFRDRDHAEQTMRYWHYDGRDKHPVRAYPCRCGSWHLTARPETGPS